MNPTRDFIFCDAQIPPEEAKAIQDRAVARLTDALRSGELTVPGLLDQVAPYTLDRKQSINRKQAYLLIDRVLTALPTEFLGAADFSTLFSLFLRSLETDTENATWILAILRTLQARSVQAKTHCILKILIEFFGNNKFSTSLYTFDVRNATYKLILEALNSFVKAPVEAAWVSANQERIVRTLVDQTEGEKDPRNLILILEIWAVVFAHFEAGVLAKTGKEVFDVLAVYFPITFDDVKNKILVNKQYMIEALNGCLSLPPLLSHFVDLILEKLEEQNKEENEAVLASIGLLFRKSLADSDAPLSLDPVVGKLRKKLDFLLFEVTDQSIEGTAKEAYKEFLGFALRSIKKTAVVNWMTRGLLEEILGDFVAQIEKKPNGKNAHAAIDVLLEVIFDFPKELLLTFLQRLATPFSALADKPATLIVYCESILPVLVKCAFSQEFGGLLSDAPGLVTALGSLKAAIDGNNDPANRLTLLKTYCLISRIVPGTAALAFHTLGREEGVLLAVTTAAISKDSAYLRLSDGAEALKFEAIVSTNLEVDPRVLSDLYLTSVIGIYSSQKEPVDGNLEDFIRLNALYSKRLRGFGVPPTVDDQRVKEVSDRMREKAEARKYKGSVIRQSLDEVVCTTLIQIYEKRETTLYLLSGGSQTPNLTLISTLLAAPTPTLDSVAISQDLERLSPSNQVHWPIFRAMVDQNLWRFGPHLNGCLQAARDRPELVGPVLCSLLRQNFTQNTKHVEEFLGKILTEQGPKTVSNYIGSILRSASSSNFQAKVPLFKQKLAQFLDKTADGLLRDHQFDYISAKLSLVNFRIFSGTSDQLKTEELNSQFLDFAIQSHNNPDVNIKYLTLMQHLIRQESVDPNGLISEKFVDHFAALSQLPPSADGLKILCTYLDFLNALLAKSKLGLPSPLARRLVGFLRRCLGHPKRLVRRLAGNAINSNAISRFADAHDN